MDVPTPRTRRGRPELRFFRLDFSYDLCVTCRRLPVRPIEAEGTRERHVFLFAACFSSCLAGGGGPRPGAGCTVRVSVRGSARRCTSIRYTTVRYIISIFRRFCCDVCDRDRAPPRPTVASLRL